MLSQRQHARDLVLNLTEEIGEYLRSIAFKHWLASEERHRDLRVYELVDILKLVLALCWTEQVTADELSSHFAAKTAIVRERMAARRQYGAKICAWDIDGVLAEDVPWLPDEATFASNGSVSKLQSNAAAVTVLHLLRRIGYEIVLVTSRKAWLYPQLEHDTYAWLQRKSIPYAAVLRGYDKMELLRRIDGKVAMAFEDKAKHALDLAAGGIPVIYLGTQPIEHKLIYSASVHNSASIWRAVEML